MDKLPAGKGILFGFRRSTSNRGQKQELEIQLGPAAALFFIAVLHLLVKLFHG
jgi:hypothetical protein